MITFAGINIQKGKNKGFLCLNRFKDVNELKYCHTHRWEMKAWLICNTNGCNGKTKVDYCRKCKKIYSSEILKIPLPPVGKDE